MEPDHHTLRSGHHLIFRMAPISAFSHDLMWFGDARYHGMNGCLLVKKEEIIFVPEDDFSILYLSKRQILQYRICRNGSDLRLAILYHVLRFPGYTPNTMQLYCFYLREEKRED